MLEKQRKKLFWWYLIPSLSIYVIFLIYPFINAFYLCLTDWDGFSDIKKFIGLKNFSRMFQDKYMGDALLHNVYLFVIGTTITFMLSMFFAVVLTQFKLKGSNFFSVVFFFPNVLSVAVISVIWMFILSPTSSGLFNELLSAVGLESWNRAWLGDMGTVLPAMSVPWVWMSVGFYMVLFIAAIKSIPVSLYESSIIDGAGYWKQFWSVTLPLMWETVRIAIVFFMLDAFNGTFTIVSIMTRGGPARASELMTTYMYDMAFKNRQFGYASAIGVFIFVFLLVLSLLALKLTKRDVNEY